MVSDRRCDIQPGARLCHSHGRHQEDGAGPSDYHRRPTDSDVHRPSQLG